jgi:radical SAM superfamily enzyme YgiQ (UPF0313 family)
VGTSVLLITPPFTQLNTPYPATAYLKGFLETKGIASHQADLGIDTILHIFSHNGLNELFNYPIVNKESLSENAKRILILADRYIETIDTVISFLQGKNPLLAYAISKRKFLPECSRFDQTEQVEWAFGSLGIQDLAKFLCTMYLEDLSDFIKEAIDPHFGFSRYAERLGRSAGTFDALYQSLNGPTTYVDKIYLSLLQDIMAIHQPELVALSVPFPGNLYAALRIGQWIKEHQPSTRIAMGGGFPNTELRSLSDKRVFEFLDFITLDDGEAPMENLIAHLAGKKKVEELKRTFLLQGEEVVYQNNPSCKDYKMADVGTPNYDGLHLDQYISALEIANPMHRLWNDGRWNKLTMAHGCYWGKCTFCDISLDYIRLYEPVAATILCDRMQEMIGKTGINGFHFVDEAAPPSLMRALALEILKRKMIVSWWTNIRFEKSFSRDLCLLLRASGCIAVSGGLEVASDRLLAMIDKGITVAQVAKVNRNLTDAGIMVHAYLMYGFPTQTIQETIDSLEMVRQLFASGVLQSGFWHQFAMTAHSPVGMNPAKYQVKKLTDEIGSFANNDVEYKELSGIDHNRFSYGLKKSLFNFMQHNALDQPLQKWFDFKIPHTAIPKQHIEKLLLEPEIPVFRAHARVLWLGKTAKINYFTQSKRGMQREMVSIQLIDHTSCITIEISKTHADWLIRLLNTLGDLSTVHQLQQIKADYEASGLEDFELFWDNKPINQLHKVGLLVV